MRGTHEYVCSLSEMMSSPWETAMSSAWRCVVRRLPKEMIHARETGRSHVDRWLVSRLRLPGSFGAKNRKTFLILFLFYFICILLINAIRTIYICYIINKGKVWLCVLAVWDDELNVGNSDSASCGGCRRRWYTHVSPGEIMWTGDRWAGSGFRVALGNRVKKLLNFVFLLSYLHSAD